MSATPTPSEPTGSLKRARARLAEDDACRGTELCRAYSHVVDTWLEETFAAAVPAAGTGAPAEGLALVAVGGYGRQELSLQSDIDVVLVHDGRHDVGTVADRLWYPIWDEGVKLGHAVRTVREALALAADDLDTATSLLSARLVAGDGALAASLSQRAQAQWRKGAGRWLARLADRVRARHERAGEVAFLLEPDLKEGRGGLRDVHTLEWAGAARRLLWDGDDEALHVAYEVLLAARVELHRRTGRAGDRLLLQEQDAVAAALGYADADDLMRAVAEAARTVAWRADDAWNRIRSSLAGPPGWRARRDRPVGEGLVVRDGQVHLVVDAPVDADPTLPLRAAAAAAQAGTSIHRATLERLRDVPPLPSPWPPAALEALVALLRAGPAAVAVIESLDQVGLWSVVLPEWDVVRCRPQRNAYHRFTVDRHLVEAAAGAARLATTVDRPDLLVLGALLHDIGKGHPGDHTDVGVELVGRIGPRLGLPPWDVATLQALVRHHLLLADTATRRDLDDPATTRAVAAAVADTGTLHLLAALTEADSLATGPAAWGSWKAALVRDLVARTAHVLDGGAPEDVTHAFPPAELVALMRAGDEVIRTDDDVITIVTRDRPGLFSRVAGVLALHGLDVLDANAASRDGMAVERFRVQSSRAPVVSWDRAVDDLRKVLDGRLALQARLAERARSYRRATVEPVRPPRVRFDDHATSDATVIEVHATDSVGLLHRITRALAELDLDLTFAKVQTLGSEVVDAFYVRAPGGGTLDDDVLRGEVERALRHELAAG